MVTGELLVDKEFLRLDEIPIIEKVALNYVFEDIKPTHNDGDLWLEFGVYNGTTINFISQFTSGTVYGFDSFYGCPVEWRGREGAFNRDGIPPEVNDNVKLVVGWFNDTLEDFLAEHEGETISFLHIDCDVYISTKYVLDKVKDYLKPGSIVVFDELLFYLGYDGDNGELRALYEFVKENDIQYEWIGRREVTSQPIRNFSEVAAIQKSTQAAILRIK